MAYLLICFMLVTLCGCAKGEKEDQEPGVVDYVTGAAQLERYKKTKSKIEDITKSREGDDFWNK